MQEEATLTAQSEAIVESNTAQAYCDWMHGFLAVTSPEESHELHSSSIGGSLVKQQKLIPDKGVLR